VTATAALLPQVDAIDDVSCVALRARPSSAAELVPAPAACSSSGAIVPVDSPPVSESTVVNALLQVSACDIPVRPSTRIMSLLSDSKRQSILLQQPRSRRGLDLGLRSPCLACPFSLCPLLRLGKVTRVLLQNSCCTARVERCVSHVAAFSLFFVKIKIYKVAAPERLAEA
jgi:hypothetical protein